MNRWMDEQMNNRWTSGRGALTWVDVLDVAGDGALGDHVDGEREGGRNEEAARLRDEAHAAVRREVRVQGRAQLRADLPRRDGRGRHCGCFDLDARRERESLRA